MFAPRQATAIAVETGVDVTELFTSNNSLNFDKYIIRVNHLATYNTPIMTRKKRALSGTGQAGVLAMKQDMLSGSQ